MSAGSYADTLERLFAQFEHRHTLTVIEDITRVCSEQLDGRIATEAQLELLERLAHQRLLGLPPTREV